MSCAVCHGDVDRMPLTFRAVAHDMRRCLDCHRGPRPRIGTRPLLSATVPSALFGEERPPGARPAAAQRRFRSEALTTCTTCHR